MLCIGCSNNNKITINNLTIEPIHINFMAVDHFVDAGASLTVNEIPNGTYTYTTTYGYPPEAKSATASGDAASGSLLFEKKDTQILLLYGYSYFDGAYVLNATMSSTRSSTSPTSP
jgi:hypothetical protein